MITFHHARSHTHMCTKRKCTHFLVEYEYYRLRMQFSNLLCNFIDKEFTIKNNDHSFLAIITYNTNIQLGVQMEDTVCVTGAD